MVNLQGDEADDVDAGLTAPWMPGTQLYTPGIHRADLKNNPFQPYP